MIKIQGTFYFCLHYSLFVIDLVYNTKEITFAIADRFAMQMAAVENRNISEESI